MKILYVLDDYGLWYQSRFEFICIVINQQHHKLILYNTCLNLQFYAYVSKVCKIFFLIVEIISSSIKKYQQNATCK